MRNYFTAGGAGYLLSNAMNACDYCKYNVYVHSQVSTGISANLPFPVETNSMSLWVSVSATDGAIGVFPGLHCI
jgi:hypothetical protein